VTKVARSFFQKFSQNLLTSAYRCGIMALSADGCHEKERKKKND